MRSIVPASISLSFRNSFSILAVSSRRLFMLLPELSFSILSIVAISILVW